MRVFLTGATGFVGSYVLRELLAQGHQVRCLMRNASDDLAAGSTSIERVEGDVARASSLSGTMRGCDAVIHLVGIIDEKPKRGVTFKAVHDEGTRNVVEEARREGIDMFIHMSANGARPEARSGYHTSKWKAEQHVKEAGFRRWTIFRPSIIFGDPEGKEEFASRLLDQLVRPFPVLPVFGDGRYELQPISAEDVAAAFVQALTREAAAGTTYCAAGQARISYRDALDVIARGAGLSPKPKIPQPIALMRPLIKLASPTGLLPISPDQFEMLIEGNTCDAGRFHADFDLRLRPFTSESLAYLARS